MRTKPIRGVILAMALGLFCVAKLAAVPIGGEIHFNGSGAFEFDNGSAAVYNTATQIDVSAVVTHQVFAPTGDYSSIPASTSVSFEDPFNFGTTGTTGPLVVNPLWSITHAGVTYEFDLATLSRNEVSGEARVLEGYGMARITGSSTTYEPTEGFWQLSSSGQLTTFSFSSATDVPEGGATVILLGLSLIGFSGIRRLKNIGITL